MAERQFGAEWEGLHFDFRKEVKMIKNKRKNKTLKIKRLTESAILISLATVLSVLKLYEMPYGGSLTLASMLPVMIIAYRYGIIWGGGCAFAYGVVQQLLSVSTLSYVTTWISVVAVILLDYVLAFAFCGLGGVFRNVAKDQRSGMAWGALLCCVLRYICHFISGCTVWAGLSIPTEAAAIYSALYNAAYMIPETLITVGAVYYVSSQIDFSKEIPVRKKAEKEQPARLILSNFIGASLLLAGFIYDVITVFSHMQNESGEFDITALTGIDTKTVFWLLGVNLFCAVVFTVLKIVNREKQGEK